MRRFDRPLGIYRFSLRTLIIVTTLVAIGLGLIVWTMHDAACAFACPQGVGGLNLRAATRV